MDNLGAPKVLCASSVLLFPSFTWGHKIYHLLKGEENKKNTEGNNPKELRQPRHTNTGYSKKSLTQASQVVLVVKNLPANAGDVREAGSIPGSGRSPGGGNSNPFQYSCLENPMDRGAWWATVHGSQRVRHNWRDLAHTHALTQSFKKHLWLPKSFPIKKPKYFMLDLNLFS